MEKKNKIFVEREIYEKDGKQYFSYFVKATIRGKDVKITVAPQSANSGIVDKNGYAVFDIVFGNENKLELITTPFEMKDATPLPLPPILFALEIPIAPKMMPSRGKKNASTNPAIAKPFVEFAVVVFAGLFSPTAHPHFGQMTASSISSAPHFEQYFICMTPFSFCRIMLFFSSIS